MQFSNALVTLIFGAITSVVALGICLLLPWNIMFFTFKLLPVGAFAVGFVAALGYYIGASMTGHRPSILLCVCMLLLSTAAWGAKFFVVYHYSNAADHLSFTDYMNEYLTHFSLKRTGHSAIKIGMFGYGVAAFQWFGFVLPAFIYFLMLRTQEYCDACEKFFKNMASLKKEFKDADSLNAYLAKLASKPPFSFQYCDVLAETAGEEGAPEAGAHAKINFALLQCPGCKGEILKSDATMKHGNKWIALKQLCVSQQVPPGTSLMTAFGKQAY